MPFAAALSKEELEQKRKQYVPKTAATATKKSEALLTEFCCQQLGVDHCDIVSLPAEELDEFLSSFWFAVRKADGSKYTKNSLKSLRYGLNRFFLEKTGQKLLEGPAFSKSTEDFLTALLKELKEEGLGSTNHHAAVPPEGSYIHAKSNRKFFF